MAKYTNTAKKTTKTTKSMSEELVNAYEALDNLKANMRALGVDISTNPTLVELDDALENIKHPKKSKKLSAREQVIHDMDADCDKIKNTQDSMLYIIKHTANSYKVNVARPYEQLVFSSDDADRLADLQFCVSALEHAANPKLIKDVDAIIITDYLDFLCSIKLNAAMMKAILEPCKVRVIELLSRINTAELNVGTEQDIIDFKARVGIAA